MFNRGYEIIFPEILFDKEEVFYLLIYYMRGKRKRGLFINCNATETILLYKWA